MRGVAVVGILLMVITSVSALSLNDLVVPSQTLVTGSNSSTVSEFRAPVEPGRPITTLVEITTPRGELRYVTYREDPIRIANTSLITEPVPGGFSWERTYVLEGTRSYRSLDVVLSVPSTSNITGTGLIDIGNTTATVRTSVPGSVTISGFSEVRPGGSVTSFTYKDLDIEANTSFSITRSDEQLELSFSEPALIELSKDAYVRTDIDGVERVLPPVTGPIMIGGPGVLSIALFNDGLIDPTALVGLPVEPGDIIGQARIITDAGPVTQPEGAELAIVMNRNTGSTYTLGPDLTIEDGSRYDENPAIDKVGAIVLFARTSETALSQGPARVGEPTVWTVQARGRAIVPATAYNISADYEAIIAGTKLPAETFERLQELKRVERAYLGETTNRRDYLFEKGARNRIVSLRSRVSELQNALPAVPQVDPESTVVLEGLEGTVTFTTPAPQMRTLFRTDTETRILVSSETHLTDVEVTASVPEFDPTRIAIEWESNGSQPIPINSMRDSDNDGTIDEITFTAPHLSDQVFRIIELSYAEELNVFGTYLRDITELVIEQDGSSVRIPDGHTVRTRFEGEIDFRGYMIVVASGNGSIDVREEGSNETIITLGPINDYGAYKRSLTGYDGRSDRFDFVVSGTVDIDFIIDPAGIAYYDPTSDVNPLWTCTGADCGIGNYAVLDEGVREPNSSIDTTDDYLSIGANSNLIEEIGFDTPTQANIDYIALWTYAETGSNFEMTVNLRNNGTTQSSLVIAPTSAPEWRITNWSSPVGIGTITAEFSQVKNGGGGPTTGFLYATYLEVGYTDDTPPTILFVSPTTATGINTTATTISTNLTASDVGGVIDTITTELFNATSGTLIDSNVSSSSPFETTFAGLSDGDYAFNATATDAATNSNTTETRFVTIDTTNPLITLVDPSETNGSWLPRSWLAFNASITETNLKTVVFNLTNGTDGSSLDQQTSTVAPFFFNFTGLVDGRYDFTAWVNDSAGNTNVTQVVTVNIDTSAPSAQYVVPTEESDAILNRSNVQVNVSASETPPEGLDTITIELRTRPGGTVVNTITSNQGDAGLYANLTKIDGLYTFNASISNRAGLVTTLETRNVTVDTTPPLLTVNSPLNNTKYLNDTVLLDVTTSDFTTSVDTVWYFNGTENITYTVPTNLTLANGNYMFTFYANDTVGNLNSRLINFTVNTTSSDTSAPVIIVQSPIETMYDTSTITVNFTASDNVAVDTLRYFNSSENITYTVPENVVLLDGEYTFFFYANDTSNNTADVSRTFTIDTIDPQISYVSITTDDATISTNTYIDVNVTASDTNLNIVAIRLYNVSDGSLIDEQSETAGFFFNFTGLADGDYSFNATAIDDAGNTNTTSTRTVTIDTTTPTGSYVPITTSQANLSQNYLEINVSASDRNLEEVRIDVYNETALVATQNSTEGFFHNFTGLSDGDYSFNATITDGAGLVTTLETRNVTLDTTLPVMSYVPPTEQATDRLSRNYIMVNVTATDENLDTITIRLSNSSGVYATQTAQTSPLFANFTNLPDAQYFITALANDSAGNVETLDTRAVDVLVNPPTTFSAYYEPVADVQTGWTCTGTSCVNGQWDALNDGEFNLSSPDVNDYIRTTSRSGLVSEHSIDSIVETEIETITLWAYVNTGSNFQMDISIEDGGTPIATTTVPTRTTSTWVSATWDINGGTPGTLTGVFETTKVGGGPVTNGDVYAWYIEVQHNDTIPPQVQFVPPTETNATSIATASIDVNVTANDTQSGLANITIYLYNSTGALIDNATTITSPDDFTFIAPADGLYRFNATAYDLADNMNVTETREITVNRTKISISDIIFEPAAPIEGESVTVRVNVSNAGPAANDVGLDLNISLWNGTWLLDEQLSSTFNISASGSSLVNFTWTAKVGTYNFSAFADPADLIEEDTNADNGYSENFSVSSYSIFYGDATNIATILSGSATDFFNWNVNEPEGVILYADSDASFFMWNLGALNGTNDLIEADTALGSTYYNDSISRLYDTDSNGIADSISTFTIGSTQIANVPVVNTTVTEAFVTGLLWDTADGGSEYDGSQDLIVITRFNATQAGAYGTYDYEVRVPVGLETLVPGADQVQRVFDLR